MRQQKERDGLNILYAMPKIQWTSNPTAPTAIRIKETFNFKHLIRWLNYLTETVLRRGHGILFYTDIRKFCQNYQPVIPMSSAMIMWCHTDYYVSYVPYLP